MKDIAFFMALFIQNRAVWQARRLDAKGSFEKTMPMVCPSGIRRRLGRYSRPAVLMQRQF